MIVSPDINVRCIMLCVGFLSERIEYRIVSLVWRCQLGLAPAYIATSVEAQVVDPFALLRGFLVVPFAHICIQRLCRTTHYLCEVLGFEMVSLMS